MKILLYVVSLLTLFTCSGKKKSYPVPTTGPVETPTATHPARRVEVPSANPISKKNRAVSASMWRYEKTTDKAGRTIYKASTTSPNVLEFGFPYAGGSTATLTIRKRDRSTTVYLQVSKGQFNRSFQGGTARIRFDRNPASTYSFSAAENGSATIIFFDSEQALINKLKATRNMVVDVEFYAQGHRQIEFRTASLSWNQ